jgi:hypothetical protein
MRNILYLGALTIVVFCSGCGSARDKAIKNYFAELDAWVDKGAPIEEIETIVASRCGRILLAYSPLLTQIRLVTIGRDDYDFWVSMCVKMTVHRVSPQPEFKGAHKASLIKRTCESHEMWRRLCNRAELGH